MENVVIKQGSIESIVLNQNLGRCFAGSYSGKRVLVTGDTGFKGAWLCEWLHALGAQVTGFSLGPPTAPSLFNQLNLSHRINHITGDIRDLAQISTAVTQIMPHFVFHLAAQSLVRKSYTHPVETYATNVMGTVNVIDSVRSSFPDNITADQGFCTLIVVTTDKCYENKEWVYAYREEDPIGGFDPYSSSKGAAELIVAAYRKSYFTGPRARVKLASVRAGNVIGGGDWAVDRIVPDCIRDLQAGIPISIRNKNSRRPWQHVLEPLSGYLWLGALLSDQTLLAKSSLQPTELAGPFNFGPSPNSNRTVSELVTEILKHWPGTWFESPNSSNLHEAHLLSLATDKAYHSLKWQPVWEFNEAISRTVIWYRRATSPNPQLALLTLQQITDYISAARSHKEPWAS